LDLMGDLRKKLEDLEKGRASLRALPDNTPDLLYLRMVVDQEIAEVQRRLDRFSTGKLPYQCSYCSGWIKAAGVPTMVGNLVICDSCKLTIRSVMNTHEAENEWGLAKGTIRQDCHPRRGVLQPYIEAGLVFLSGRYWHIHRSVMYAHYGAPKGPAAAIEDE
jgi:hypothetical protein